MIPTLAEIERDRALDEALRRAPECCGECSFFDIDSGGEPLCLAYDDYTPDDRDYECPVGPAHIVMVSRSDIERVRAQIKKAAENSDDL